MTDRLPPSNGDAEKRLIGGIFRHPAIIGAVLLIVGHEDFYHDQNRRIFAALSRLSHRNAPIDLVSVSEQLRSTGDLEAVGGPGYLAELWEAEPTGANAEYHAKLVRECSLVRSLIHVANEILRDAYDRFEPAEDMIAAAERKVYSISETATRLGETIVSAPVLMREALQRIDDRCESGSKTIGAATGYYDLDNLLAGMRPGQMVVVGARPSVGKTAFALNIARKVALRSMPVLFFSLEMPRHEIADRLLAMGSGVSMHKINSTAFDAGDVEKLTLAASERGIGGCDFFLDDCPSQTSDRLLQISRRAVRKFGIQAIFVDYLQLLRAANPRENRAIQVGEMARGVKNIARELNVPVMCLAQLNREVENRPGAEPRMSDLRDSGEIEQHADDVILLHRAPNQPADADVWTIDAKVEKNRNGPTGRATLAFRRQVMAFENWTPS